MPSREEKIRKRLFSGASTFGRAAGGFTTLPLILRRAQFLFSSPRYWQVYTYVMMRSGKHGVAWFTLQEMAWDLAFKSVSKLKPYVDELVAQGWLLRSTSSGKDYYLVVDPHVVLAAFHKKKKLPEDRVEDLDELAESLNRKTLESEAASKTGE